MEFKGVQIVSLRVKSRAEDLIETHLGLLALLHVHVIVIRVGDDTCHVSQLEH